MDVLLRSLLGRYAGRFQPETAPVALGNAGGESGSRLWRFRSEVGELLLRAWPPEGPRAEALGRIHDWLKRARGLRFVPQPIEGLDGRTVQTLGGSLWELTPWMPGEPERARPPGRNRVRHGYEALAAFHQALSTAVPGRQATSPNLGRRWNELTALRQGDLDRLEAAVRAQAQARAPEAILALEWVRRVRPLLDPLADRLGAAIAVVVPVQPCLRDARAEHLLFEGDRVTGLVDFGAMGIDSVGTDLARLTTEWLPGDEEARSDALQAYEGIRPLDPAERALLEAFESSALILGPGHWVRWQFVEGRRFSDPDAARRGLERGLFRLEQARLARPDRLVT